MLAPPPGELWPFRARFGHWSNPRAENGAPRAESTETNHIDMILRSNLGIKYAKFWDRSNFAPGLMAHRSKSRKLYGRRTDSYRALARKALAVVPV